MSRIGKRPVPVPAGVSADIANGILTVKGPKGALTLTLRDEISYTVEDSGILVKPGNETKQARAFWGMQRTLVDNLVTGVTEGYTKTLNITGVGYRANMQGKNLKLQLGYSHDVDYSVPEGIEIKTPDRHDGRDQRHRQAGGRPVRRRDPPSGGSPSRTRARASSYKRRVHLPQGRKEEVMAKLSLFERRKPSGAQRPEASGRVPGRGCRCTASGKPHLRTDHRRCRRAAPWPPPRH